MKKILYFVNGYLYIYLNCKNIYRNNKYKCRVVVIFRKGRWRVGL